MALNASVCIPSYNRREMLLATLRSLERQTADTARFEVIVTDDGSSDGTAEALSDFRAPYRLTWFTQANGGLAAARNAAARRAANEVLIFIDADQVCAPEAVAAHLEIHEREGNVLVQGLYPCADGYRSRATSLVYDWWLLNALAPIDRPHRLSLDIWGGHISVRRSTWEQVGGFDSTTFRHYGREDTDFGLRVAALGVPFLFDPRALSYHLHEVGYRSFRRQGYEEGRAVIRFAQKHGTPAGTLDKPIDRIFKAGWARSPRAMEVVGRVLTVGMMASDAARLRPAQLLSARFVHRLYVVGGLVAAGLHDGTAAEAAPAGTGRTRASA